jgi:Baseplate J-like protein
MAGVDPVLGFVRRTAEDINQQILDDLVANLSPALDVSSSSPAGQIASAVTKIAAELWDGLEATYDAGDPDKNTGDGQDAVCAITGTSREPATHSQVRETLNLNAGATVPVGALMSVQGNPTSQFRSVGSETVAGTVVPGDVVAGGAGTYYARFEAVETGPVVANAGTLTVIVTPQTGWNSGTNALDAAPGHDIESSTDLRLRREEELAAAGSTPVDALRAELSQLLAANDIAGGFADVVENVQDVVDADFRPPHCIECLIDDGPSPLSNDLIAQVIWDGRAGGIRAFGLTSGNATDDLGITRVTEFTRPTPKLVYFAVSVVIDSSLFPSDGDAQIKAAMVALGQTLKPGQDVIRNQFFAPVFGIVGVVNCTVLNLGFAPSPGSSADLVIGVRERATFDTSRITVSHV